jgi:phosphoglycolate phosphatase
MYQLVLFDLDGTVLDTAPDIADALGDWLAAKDLPPLPADTVKDRIGRGTQEMLVQVYADASGTPPEELRRDGVVQRMMDEYFPHFMRHCGRRSRLYPGARECLVQARSAGIHTVLITNKERRATQPLLEAHDLERLFDLTVCGDTLSARKPHPLPVLHCLQAFNVPPSRALLIGDSDIDVQTARNAGISAWTVPHGYSGGRPISGADRVMPDFAAITDALLQANAATMVRAPAGTQVATG